MPDRNYSNIRKLLSSTHPEDIKRGLELAGTEIRRLGSDEAKPLFEMVSALFYIDALDHPELVPLMDEAVSLSASFGSWVIPILIENLDAGDIKAEWAVAHVLGRIGADAIDPMLRHYAETSDPSLRAFILYALGKIRSPEISKAAAVTLAAAQSPELEVRDTATRALGKFIESIPPESLTPKMKGEFLECLLRNLSDGHAAVRAKAARSLGKMAKFGHLDAIEKDRLRKTFSQILGTDEKGEWDRAFIVRKEAEEAVRYL